MLVSNLRTRGTIRTACVRRQIEPLEVDSELKSNPPPRYAVVEVNAV